MADLVVDEALGRISELLVEKGAKVRLNEIRGILSELANDAYEAGYNCLMRDDDRANEMEDRAYEAETARECLD